MYDSYSSGYGSMYQENLIIWVFAVLIYALMCFFYSRIFIKAEKPMWEAFVPVYNTYILSEIAFGKGIFCILGYIPYVNALFFAALHYKLGVVFNRSSLFNLGLVFLPFVFLPILAISGNS